MVSKKINYANLNSIGQIFTPHYIAEFMVQNSLKFMNALGKPVNKVKVLEPSVGKGIFLKYLLQYNFKDITAYEIDINLKCALVKTYPEVNFRFENVLGSDLNEKFDLIIGNPPYLGQNYHAEVFQEYIKKFPICAKYFVGNMDLFYFFIHMGISKLNPGGILSYITTNYWITKSKKTGIKFLKPHILKECLLQQYIDLSNLKIFKDATGQHNCIFLLKKKTKKEKEFNLDSTIEVAQITKNGSIEFYQSALKNSDLKPDKSWNLSYPNEVKELVDKIEQKCVSNGRILYLRDFFIIRNGLIFIKDDIFILKQNKDIRFENEDIFIRINGEYVKLTKNEKKILKRIYKSKSIIPYGYIKDSHIGYAIYLNKNEFYSSNVNERNKLYQEAYPYITKYLNTFETHLREILINAKENPEDFYFPRRGTFIRRSPNSNGGTLIDLEPLYENGEKIFIRYISDENTFGFSDSSYYATSDTYFLWPIINGNPIDFAFILAYLNSQLVYFLFKAKNLKMKRSKTKLEDDLPIPNMQLFTSEKELAIIQNIKDLSTKQILLNSLTKDERDKIDSLFYELFNLSSQKISQIIRKYYIIKKKQS